MLLGLGGGNAGSVFNLPFDLCSVWVWSDSTDIPVLVDPCRWPHNGFGALCKTVYVSTAEFIAQPGLLQLIISQTNNLSLRDWGLA